MYGLRFVIHIRGGHLRDGDKESETPWYSQPTHQFRGLQLEPVAERLHTYHYYLLHTTVTYEWRLGKRVLRVWTQAILSVLEHLRAGILQVTQ